MSTFPAVAPKGLLESGTEAKPIPLQGVSVEAVLRDFAAKMVVTQRYLNAEAHPIEAVYVFPLDEAAAICGFEALVDGRKIVASVEEREKAFEVYDDALRAGHGAYLLDQETPEIFTASLGNIPPGAEVLVRITTVAELRLDGDHIRFTIPTTVSPRYAPFADRQGVGQSREQRHNPPRAFDVPYGLELRVSLEMSGRLASVESPSHAIRVEGLRGGQATVELATREEALDRDFVLKVAFEEPHAPRAVVEMAADGQRHVLAAFRAALQGESAPAELVFLVDRSGSMQGGSIAEAREALQLALRSLRSGSFFNIVGFGDRHQSLFPESRPYDDDSLKRASAYLASLDADMGGTEILGALEFVLAQKPRPGLIRRMVLLTDGQVTNTDAVIALVRKHSNETRVFTFGIGAGASAHLVRGVARAGEGAAEFIAPGERIGPKVLRQLGRALAPALAEVSVEWGDGVEPAPHHLPPVFDGERLLVYGRLIGASGPVTLRGRGPGGEIRLTVTPEPAPSGGPIIATLWARAAIRDLEEGRSKLHDRHGSLQERGGDRVRPEIVRLAKAYGLASSATSFVAVETREKPVEGEAQLRRIPIALTRGWGGGGGLILGSARSVGPAAPGSFYRAADVRFGSAAPVAASAAPGMIAKLVDWTHQFLGPKDTDAEIVADIEPALEASPARGRAPRSAPRRPLDRLASLQKADGSWDLSAGLARVVGQALPALEKVAASNGWSSDEATSAWATALALAWLEAEADGDRDEWTLLAGKARDWLVAHAGKRGPDAFLAAAREVIRQG